LAAPDNGRQKGVGMTEREREVTMRFLAEPTDINFGGKVHGGAVMKWIDQAGYACAVGWSGQYCVTVYVGGIRFYKPVLIGNVVEVHAKLVYTGRTSMHVVVDVGASDPKDRRHTKTTHCVMVFVAIDEQGNPVEVSRWQPETEEDAALERYAKRLMELRKGIEETEANLPGAVPL
jgi:acyl-CoA hydrolase